MNEIVTIGGIDCYEENGKAYLKLETVARGLGFTRVAASGNEVIRWETVRKYLSELSVPTSWHGDSQQVGKEGLPEYIPENVFYRLAMKAKNETAEKFQAYVADEVIPSIRKHGAYMTPETVEELLMNPDTMIELLQRLKEEQARRKELETVVSVKDQQIAEMTPKAGYYDLILMNKDVMPISKIAKDYGMSAQRMNILLHEMGVQYKQGDIWLLYQQYAGEGYTHTKTDLYVDGEGEQHTRVRTCWTQKGRLFIYDLLKNKYGILPLIEREVEAS